MSKLNFRRKTPSLHWIFYMQISLLLTMALLSIIGYYQLANVGAFFFTVILGALGASISLMKRYKQSQSVMLSDVASNELLAILMPILYGTVLSGVAYLFFVSGILSGDGGRGMLTTNLFPNFTIPGSSDKPLIHQFIDIKPCDMTDTGKLLVWCFLAGYSERFVTGILMQLESRTSFNKKSNFKE